jgi:hypothetical protein
VAPVGGKVPEFQRVLVATTVSAEARRPPS